MQCVANQWYKGQTGKALCYSLLIQWPYFSALMGYSSCFDPARMQLGFNPVRDVIIYGNMPGRLCPPVFSCASTAIRGGLG